MHLEFRALSMPPHMESRAPEDANSEVGARSAIAPESLGNVNQLGCKGLGMLTSVAPYERVC